MEGACMNRLIFLDRQSVRFHSFQFLKRLPPDSHYSTDWLDVEGSELCAS
jgi:hypothetical protein